MADTSAEYDRQVKLPLYAQSGIQEVWIVDLSLGRLEIYRSPRATGYREISIRQRGDQISPLAFPDLSLAVDQLL